MKICPMDNKIAKEGLHLMKNKSKFEHYRTGQNEGRL